MTGAGLMSVENPGAAFAGLAGSAASGCAVTAVLEGSRAITVEVQALAVPSFLASPRRVATGIETSRLHLLLAVLARRGNLNAGGQDIVATVSGGLRVRDPAADLAVLCALASAIRDRMLPEGTGFCGEVALSGATRPVPAATRRIAEMARNGVRRCLAPPGSGLDVEGVEIVPVRTVREALDFVLTG
jgi:DNA repair protein RadA/Sms